MHESAREDFRRSTDCPNNTSDQGRFLRKRKLPDDMVQDIASPMSEIVSDSVAVEKVKQAFRDMDHRTSISSRASGAHLPEPPSAPPVNAPRLTPSADTLSHHLLTLTTGSRASIHSNVGHGNDPTSRFFNTNQSSRSPTQSVPLHQAESESSLSFNLVDNNALDRNVTQPSHEESENRAMVILADIATHQLSTPTSTDTPSLIPTFPAPSFSAPTLAIPSTPVQASLFAPLLLQTSSHSRLDLSSLAPDVLQRISQQVAYRDLSHRLATPLLSHHFGSSIFPADCASYGRSLGTGCGLESMAGRQQRIHPFTCAPKL
jgi:hypothetical protein